MNSASGTLIRYDRERIMSLTHQRPGEQRVGDVIGCSGEGAVAIVGIPEDIGVRANLGRPGAHAAWSAFLGSFLSLPVSRGVAAEQIGLVAEVFVEDLVAESAAEPPGSDTLRAICARLDTRVEAGLSEIAQSGLVLVVVGGGHNNALPLLAASSRALQSRLRVINFDAHADCRPMEGRHSGNAFTYAQAAGYLVGYMAVGVDDAYTSQAVLDSADAHGHRLMSIGTLIRGAGLTANLLATCEEFAAGRGPVGIDVDLDVIPFMPSSAMSPSGVPLPLLTECVRFLAERLPAAYLHLPEGAPDLAPSGHLLVGKALASLVVAFLAGRRSYAAEHGGSDAASP